MCIMIERITEDMISNKLKSYITEHCFCSEYLFKDWESFLDILYAEGARVTSVMWWDHCNKSEQDLSAGSGGYVDPENPEYIYTETQLFKDGLETYTLDEIKEYIQKQRKSCIQYGHRYVSHDLVPSFYLDE